MKFPALTPKSSLHITVNVQTNGHDGSKKFLVSVGSYFC